MQEGRTGEGWEILYDQIVKHGFIICKEIKASQKDLRDENEHIDILDDLIDLDIDL